MKIVGAFLWLVLLSVAPTFAPPQGAAIPPAPQQPLPYSHKQHLALGLQCQGCHTMPEPGNAATFPPTATCMSCHTTIKTDSPSIQKLAASHAQGQAIAWERVYKLPGFVFFSHKQHVTDAAVTCEVCHGAVSELDVMQKVKDISMTTCLGCHREKKAPDGCDVCHEPRG